MKLSIKILLCAIVITAMCLTVFACNQEAAEATPLNPVNGESIAYDGSTLTWTGVDNAEGYTLFFDDSTDGITVSGNSYTISMFSNFKVGILSVANNATYCSATSKGEANFTYLKPVGEISVSKRTSEESLDYFTWAPVEGAEYYALSENGVIKNDIRVELTQGAEVLKNPIATDGNGGTASLSVLSQSSAKNTFSSWSDTKTVTVLATPTNFAFDPDANIISWAPSAGTITYKTRIGKPSDTPESYEWENVSAARYIYRGSDEEFAFAVKAMGDYDKDIIDGRLVTRIFRKQEEVNGLRINYGTVSWNGVVGCDAYEVNVSVTKLDEDGLMQTEVFDNTIVNGTTYNGLTPQYNEERVGSSVTIKPCSYNVMVRPTVNSSDADDIVTYSGWTSGAFSILRSPVIEWRGNQKIAWNEVPAAGGYFIKILHNGTTALEESISSDRFDYNYDYLQLSGTYTVSVAALYTNESETPGSNSSRPSNTIEVVVLPAPEDYTVISNRYAIASGIDSLGKGTTPEYIDEEAKKADDTVHFYFNDVEYADYYDVSHRYDYTFVEVTGDGKPDDTQKIDESAIALDTINISDTVDNEKLLGDKNFNINQIIATASGRKDILRLFARNTNNDRYDEESGRVILNSSLSTDINITKLAAPSNLIIRGNLLSWDAVNENSGYRVFVRCLDNPDYSYVKIVYGTSYDLEIADVGKYYIYVAALGNDNVIISSNYSNYITAVKLPAVTGLKVETINGSECLSWVYTPYKNDDIEYNPTSYKILLGTHIEYLSMANKILGSSLSLEDKLQFLTTSGSTCAVYAMGSNNREDQVVTLHSVASSTISVYRLDTPSTPEVNADSVTWSGVNYTQTYEIYNAENLLGTSDSTKTFYTLTKESLNLLEGSSLNFSIAVRAIRNSAHTESDPKNSYFVSSLIGPAIDIEMLKIPEVTVAADTGIMSWKNVTGARGYLVKVVNTTTGAALTYSVAPGTASDIVTYDPVVVGKNDEVMRISVVATGNNINTIDSFAYSYTTTLKKLELPTGDFTITPFSKDGFNYFKVVIDDYIIDNETTGKGHRTTLGRGYYVNIDGVDNFTDTGIFELPATVAQAYSVRICAAGANYSGSISDGSEGNTCYINSDYTEAKVVHVLGVPSEDNISFSTGGVGDITKRMLAFTAVDNANGYKITVTYETAEFGELGTEPLHKTVEGYPVTKNLYTATNTIEVTDNSAALYSEGIVNNKVQFILDNITADVYWIKVSVMVLGDDITSISSGVTTVTYTVR